MNVLSSAKRYQMTKIILATRNTSLWPEFGGSIWVRLQYMLGFQKLGFETFWVDRLKKVDSKAHPHSIDYLVKRFDHTAQEFGFKDNYCIIYDNGNHHYGMSKQELIDVISDAGLLVNISGYMPKNSPLRAIPRRAYIDVDPGFTQMWAHQWDMGISSHNFYFTTGQNVRSSEFKIPLKEIDWNPIIPPVVLDQWTPHIDESSKSFTTVADWRSSQVAEFAGVKYGTKRLEFKRFMFLPMRTNQTIELALLISPYDYEDIKTLINNNWMLKDPILYSGDPHSYRQFIQNSRGEFSVAKHGYVSSYSGWVSDRTACYLASGKPALVQSTGFESFLPTGQGLLTFSTIDEAVDGFDAINSNYLSHCHAARHLAEKYFNSDRILNNILEIVGLH